MKRLLMAGLCLLASACVATPPNIIARAADPAVQIHRLAVSDTTADVRLYQPVEPDDWLTINRRLAPSVTGDKR